LHSIARPQKSAEKKDEKEAHAVPRPLEAPIGIIGKLRKQIQLN
jgi:hypothetical protein